MKSVLLMMIVFFSTSIFAQTAQTFFNQVKGKSIVGKSVEGLETIFEFAQDGKTVLLKKNSGYNHTFVKMVGNIAVYKGTRSGKTHYDGFRIRGTQILVATSDQIGGINLTDNTPEGLAKVFDKNMLRFQFQ